MVLAVHVHVIAVPPPVAVSVKVKPSIPDALIFVGVITKVAVVAVPVTATEVTSGGRLGVLTSPIELNSPPAADAATVVLAVSVPTGKEPFS
jgi:hypothetical protein